jgi:hypothetical protein
LGGLDVYALRKLTRGRNHSGKSVTFLTLHVSHQNMDNLAEARVGNIGRSATMNKLCEPLDERSYDGPPVSYNFVSLSSHHLSHHYVLPCSCLWFISSTHNTTKFLQTNCNAQMYQFNLLLTSFKFARKTKALKQLHGIFLVRSEEQKLSNNFHYKRI